jgi:flagellar FliJ protein
MSTRFPLQTLLELSQTRLDDATRQLGELMAGEREAAQRLELLVQYRTEYHNRFLSAAQGGINQDQWRNFQAFLGKLDVAIGQAQDAVNRSKQMTAVGQKQWVDQRGQVKAYDTLAQRHQSRLDYAEQRRDQKAQDEHTARRFLDEHR